MRHCRYTFIALSQRIEKYILLPQVKLRLDELEQMEQQDTTPPVLPWMAEYAKHKIILWWAERASRENLPSLNLLFPDKRLAHLSVDSPYVRACRKRVEQIQSQHQVNETDPIRQLQSPQFADAFTRLRDAMVQQLQKQVEQLCRERWLLNHYVQKLSGRPKEQKKVLSNLEKSRSKITDALQQLKAWATGVFFGKPAAAPAAMDWVLDNVLQLQFPWEPVSSHADGHPLSANDLFMKLLHHRQEFQRAREELDLIKGEKDALLRLHGAQLEAMQAHVQGLWAQIATYEQQLSELLEVMEENPSQPSGPALQSLQQQAAIKQEIKELKGRIALVRSRQEFVHTVLASAKRLFGTPDSSTTRGDANPDVGATDVPADATDAYDTMDDWDAMDEADLNGGSNGSDFEQ